MDVFAKVPLIQMLKKWEIAAINTKIDNKKKC
jgi:hypothetical protein